MADFCDPRINLSPRQLTAFPGLRALRHFDLKLLGFDEIQARHAETAGSDLLDGAVFRVPVRHWIIPFRILAALASVALAADTVHGDRKGFVRFLADRAVAH